MNGPTQAEDGNYVLSLDLGTTTLRAFIYDQNGTIKGCDTDEVHLLQPKPGHSEMDPEILWKSILKVMKNALKNANLQFKNVKCCGISTQRATFINWRKSTGRPFHNFITWKDLRADQLVKEWNSSLTMKGIRCGSKFLHLVTRQNRFMVGSILKFQNKMVVMRLLWALQNIPELIQALKENDVMFGTLDSWLIYKFTKLHLSNISNSAATGLYDPFSLSYAAWAFNTLGIPKNIMPKVVDDSGDHFGFISGKLFGENENVQVPISCVMADQSASVFGQGCFHPGQLKMSLGSGSFLDVNTGQDVHASIRGLVPLVGWKMGSELVYFAEGAFHDTSSVILWAQQFGLFEKPSDSSSIAESTQDSNLFFIPGFGGLQAPINDPNATAGFIGLTPKSTKEEMLKAVLESIAFGMNQLLDILILESPHSLKSDNIMVDGGVSNNDFIVGLISTLTGKRLDRFQDTETSAFGVAFVAGLQTGVWNSKKDISKLRKVKQSFYPDETKRTAMMEKYKKWTEACHRFKQWH